METLPRVYHNFSGKPWLRVKITTEGDTKFVDILSSIHMVKSERLTVSYSTSFTDGQILRDSNFLNVVRRFI